MFFPKESITEPAYSVARSGQQRLAQDCSDGGAQQQIIDRLEAYPTLLHRVVAMGAWTCRRQHPFFRTFFGSPESNVPLASSLRYGVSPYRTLISEEQGAKKDRPDIPGRDFQETCSMVADCSFLALAPSPNACFVLALIAGQFCRPIWRE